MRRSEQLKSEPARLRPGRLLSALAALGLALGTLTPSIAHAGDKDADALIAIAEAMNELMEGKFDEGLGRLDEMVSACKGKACDANIRAQLHMAMGIIWGSGRKDVDKAREEFERALKEDPTVTLDRQWATKDVEKAFAQAKAATKQPGGDHPKKPPKEPLKEGPTKEQLEALAQAESLLAQKDWSTCMATLIAAMSDKEFAAGKLALARCEDAGNLLLEATADANAGKKLAESEGNSQLASEAQELIDKLHDDTPTITLVIPKAWSDVEAKVDGVAVPKDKVTQPIPHNPGKATIEVSGKKGRFPTSFKSTEPFGRGEQITVNVDDGQSNNSAVLQCIMAAKTPADVNLCIETGGKGRGLTIRAGAEIAGYIDTDNTDVFSPAIFLSAENPTSGWSIGGSFLVDVVSTASADIVASASRRLDEVRYAATLAGDYKIDVARVGLNGGLSVEGDYVARSVGASVGADLFEKMVTPSIAYQLSLDTIGLTDTPFDVYSKDVTRHTIDAGVSLVIDPSTIAVGGGTLEISSGDTSKPYRHVPLFTSEVAERIPVGATPDLVSDNRAPLLPFERLPDSRLRIAVFGRMAHRFEDATVRADERLYIDTWGQKASTTDARYLIDLTERFRVGPHLRFHVQGPVDFWSRAYVTERTTSSLGWTVPEYRTTDRELGPLIGVTGGGLVRYALTEDFAAGFEVNALYTRFLDHLYLQDRLGVLMATTLELEVK